MLGLTLALRLAQRGNNVTIIEAAPGLGGLTASFTRAGITWDRFYHVIATSDTHLLGLLDELGLAGDVTWGTTKTNFYDGAELYPLNDVFDYLRLPALSAMDKARLGLNILYGSLLTDGVALEQQNVEDWLVRWSGRRTFEKLWRPLLRAKLGDNFKHASAAYIWAIIRRFYGARHGQSKTELFGYVRGGYSTVIDAMVSALEKHGVALECGSAVEDVSSSPTGITVATSAGVRTFDQVAVTFASPIAARICAGLEPGERSRHAEIRYQDASESDIEALFLPGIAQMFPDFTPSDIVAVHHARTRYVTAISTLNYSAMLPPMATSVPGLYICNSSHIVNASLSVTETIDLANRAAARIDG